MFRNIVLPGGESSRIRVLSGGGYDFELEDVWYGSQLVNSQESAMLRDDGDKSTKLTISSKNNDDIRVFINGWMVKFDTPPVLKDDRTLVPIRAISAALGADVLWNDAEQKVTIKIADKSIELVIGSTEAIVNGETKTLDVPAQVINDRTFVPLRFIGEAFDAKVNWIEQTKTVDITSDVFAVYEEEKADSVALGTELLDNPGFESDLTDLGAYGYGWEAHNDSKITIIKDDKMAQEGKSFLKVSERKHGYSGVRQMVISQLSANGPGKYKITAYVRSASPTAASVGQKFHMTLGINSTELDEQKNYSKFFEMSADWQKVENEADLQWTGDLTMARLVIVGSQNFIDDFYVDGVSLTKIQ